MFFTLLSITRLLRRLRRRRGVGISLLVFILLLSIVGNALTFFFFDRSQKPELGIGDAFWYSIISIATIGYGDLSSTSLGARIGTSFFIVFVGLASFTTAVGIGIDWMLEYNQRGRYGMGSAKVKNHLLIVNFPNERRVRQIIKEYLADEHHKDDEIVIATDRIETLPFSQLNVHFVHGSPLEQDTYERANAKEAHQAIVLSTTYDDPNSDSVVASAVSILEHVNPELRSVAEVLSTDHALLFNGSKNVSLVFTFRMSNNLLVQEALDPGVNMLTLAITSNEQVDGNLGSTKVVGSVPDETSYTSIAKKLLDHNVNLVGIVRDEKVYLQFDQLSLIVGDRLVYISPVRHDWDTIMGYLNA